MTPEERAQLAAQLQVLRGEIRIGIPVHPEFFWGIIDAMIRMLDPPKPEEAPQPWEAASPPRRNAWEILDEDVF